MANPSKKGSFTEPVIISLTAAVAAFTGMLFGIVSLGIVLIFIALTVLSVIASFGSTFSRKKLDRFFEGANLKNAADVFPTIHHVDRDVNKETYFIKMPAGLCQNDFENKKQAIEQFLDKDVELKYKNGMLSIEAKNRVK